MKAIEHPSQWLDQKVAEAIRQKAFEAENLRQLHPSQIKLIQQERWLHLFVPKEFGGLELSIPEVLKIEEALAWADGSTAWVVTLCAGAAWFVGFLDFNLAKEIFADRSAFFAGSGAPTGTAEKISDGYLLNGNWKYASGSLHATVFTANCMIQKNGKTIMENGSPMIRAFVMKQNEITLHKTWNSMGMIATGSHSFEAKNLKVSENRCFQIDSNKATINRPIFKYPFLQLAETTLAVNLSGLAIRFIELAEELIAQKPNGNRTRSMKSVKQAKSKLNDCRTQFYTAVDTSWKSCTSKKSIPKTELLLVSKTSHALAKQSRVLVNELYPHCGLTAADTAHEINRVWRNLHTASQHSLFNR